MESVSRSHGPGDRARRQRVLRSAAPIGSVPTSGEGSEQGAPVGLRSCLRVEREALAATARRLDASFVATARAVDRALAAGGKLVCEMGNTNNTPGTKRGNLAIHARPARWRRWSGPGPTSWRRLRTSERRWRFGFG